MSKAEFFRQLRDQLRGLPEEERQRIVKVYEDLFLEAEANGKNEQEITQSLGFHPAQPLPEASRIGSNRPADTGIRVVIAAIALGLFNLTFVLGPFVGITAALFSLALAAVILTTSIVWIVIGTGFPASALVLQLEVFTVLAATGLGLLLGIAVKYLAFWYFRIIKVYVRRNIRLVKGE